MKKIVFVISHPIQYYVPLLQSLNKNEKLDVQVLYTWGEQSVSKFDPGFNRVIEWDMPLLEGYNYRFLKNIANDPGTHHFNGINNPNILEIIKAFNPDKIVILGWSFKSHLKVLRYFKNKIPIYFRGDSHLLNEAGFLKNVLRSVFLKWVYSHIDFAIAVGTNNKEYYRKMGLTEKQILFAPHAIDNNRFTDNKEFDIKLANEYRIELNIPPQNLVFIYTGKFEYRKNLETLIQAKLALSDQNCSLIMVGNGPDENTLKELAKNDNQIHFLDFVNQSLMPSIYRIGDVFVLPSISETWGLGINEAMCCGLAIIASDKVGSAIDLVKDNGFIFKNKNAIDLQEKMLFMINDRAFVDNCKANSINNIKNWSLAVLNNKFEGILTDEL